MGTPQEGGVDKDRRGCGGSITNTTHPTQKFPLEIQGNFCTKQNMNIKSNGIELQ